jgi:AcrR family transcriptional regulator
MARTAKHSKEELREMAAGAARAVISEEGSRNLNVRAVAKRMGYSVGTIYNIFEGLEELVAWLNAETLDRLHDAMAMAPVTGNAEADLHGLLDRYLAFVAENRDDWAMMFEARLPEAKAPPAWYLEKVAQVFGLLARFMHPLFGPGEEQARDQAVRLLWIALHGLWTLAADGKLFMITDVPVDRVAHAMLDTHLAAIRAQHVP